MITESKATYERLAETFGALADPTRARIVHLLLEEERYTEDLARMVGVSEPAVSQHLRLLRRLGLVASRRQGRYVYYRLDDDHVAQLVRTSLAHLAEGRGDG
ncbi:MAG: helix-turn-helix transcriptional regulator [Candidatus Dormibacteraeota bacterium]|nr:helix-turn-helix transcriptional regulator [Candidatus Dormibacteraeota bacterium]MBO0745147.1 helix-turn-helix transcriptional regulator [Candidatus Dormibacteraeota bacterium]